MMYSGVNDQNIDFIASSEQNLQILYDMAKNTIYPPTPKSSPLDDDDFEYAAEGALLLQLALQNLNGAPLMDQLVKPIVLLALQRLNEPNKHLTKTFKR